MMGPPGMTCDEEPPSAVAAAALQVNVVPTPRVVDNSFFKVSCDFQKQTNPLDRLSNMWGRHIPTWRVSTPHSYTAHHHNNKRRKCVIVFVKRNKKTSRFVISNQMCFLQLEKHSNLRTHHAVVLSDANLDTRRESHHHHCAVLCENKIH